MNVNDQDMASVRQAIELSRQDYINAMKRSDAAGLAQHFAEDAILLPQGSGSVRGRAAIEQWFQRWLPSTQVLEFDVVAEELRLTGNVAYEVGRHRMIYQMQGSHLVNEEGKFLMVYEKDRQGRWRISRDMFNTNGPAAQST